MGLLDSLDDPKTAGLLSLGLRLMSTPGSFGQALGQSGLGALGDIQGMKQAAMKQKLQEAQIADVQAQEAQRRAAAEKQAALMSSLQNVLGSQPQPSRYGLAGGGVSMGGVREEMRPTSGGLAGASPEQIAMLKAQGVDISNLYEMAKFGKEMQPGYRRNIDGSLDYFGDPTKGLKVDGQGRVSLMPGAAESQAALAGANAGATTSATEAAKAPYTLVDMYDPATGRPGKVPLSSLVNPKPTMQQQSGPMPRAEFLQAASEPGTQFSSPAVRAAVMRAAQQEPQAKPAGYVATGQSAGEKRADATTDKVNSAWLETSYKPTVAAGGAARDTIAAVKTARFALSDLGDTGFGTNAKMAAARFLGALGVPNAEQYAANGAIFQKAAGDKLFTLLGEQKGPQTEGDAARGMQLFASLSNPKQANRFILDLAQAKAEWDQKRAEYFNEALPFARQSGDLQEIDRRWQRIAPSVFDLPSMQVWKGRIK